MKPWWMERKTWSCLCLAFWCLHCSLLIIPNFNGFILTGCGNKWLSYTNIHTYNSHRMIMQINWLKCKFDRIFTVLIFNFSSHKWSIWQKNQYFILINADRTNLNILITEILAFKLLFILLILIFVNGDVFIC